MSEFPNIGIRAMAPAGGYFTLKILFINRDNDMARANFKVRSTPVVFSDTPIQAESTELIKMGIVLGLWFCSENSKIKTAPKAPMILVFFVCGKRLL